MKSVDALEELFQAHYPRVARIIANVLRDPGRAEELAVDVFLKYPRRAPDSPEAWLHRTAVHAAIDELRRRQRFQGWRRFWPSRAANGNGHDQHRLTRALSRLPPRDAQLLALDAEGFTYAEIASALGLNPASVGTMLSRAKQAFRQEYGEP